MSWLGYTPPQMNMVSFPWVCILPHHLAQPGHNLLCTHLCSTGTSFRAGLGLAPLGPQAQLSRCSDSDPESDGMRRTQETRPASGRHRAQWTGNQQSQDSHALAHMTKPRLLGGVLPKQMGKLRLTTPNPKDAQEGRDCVNFYEGT